MLRAESAGQDPRAREPILERNDHATLGNQRQDLPRRGFHVPQLDAKHDDIARRKRSGIVGEGGVGDRRVTARALDHKAAFANGGQVRAARDERHVVAGLRQSRAEVAADAAGADHRNAHRTSPFIHNSNTRMTTVLGCAK